MVRKRQINGPFGGRGSNSCVSRIGKQVIIFRTPNCVGLHYNLILSGEQPASRCVAKLD